jgi:hypothetical protein
MQDLDKLLVEIIGEFIEIGFEIIVGRAIQPLSVMAGLSPAMTAKELISQVG